MKVFEGTDLPDDLLEQVQRYFEGRKKSNDDSPMDAAYAILGRNITHAEKLAILDAVWAGRVSPAHQSSGIAPQAALRAG